MDNSAIVPSLTHKRKLFFLLDCIGSEPTSTARNAVWDKLKKSVSQAVSTVADDTAADIVAKYESLEEALISAIATENLRLVDMLLDYRDDVFNARICEEDKNQENFIPLLLAAQGKNFDILKIFIMKGYTKIEEPHEYQCGCETCESDPLLASRCRIETLRALASPLWIAFTSENPFLQAFILSDKLTRLVEREDEFENEFNQLSVQCKSFALGLLDQCMSSEEQYVVLNHSKLKDKENKTMTDRLELIKLAMEYDQKEVSARIHRLYP